MTNYLPESQMNAPANIRSGLAPNQGKQYEGDNLAVLELIPDSTLTALDVGCGKGGTAALLARKGIAVDGVSCDTEELAAAGKVCRRVIQCDVSYGLPGLVAESYDCILCSHILEHIAYPQQLLQDIHRVLRKDGTLIVVIPNLFFWSDRLKLLMGRWEYQPFGTFDYTHLRWYTRKSLVELITSHGFVAEKFFALGWMPFPGLKYLIGSNLRARLNVQAARWLPGLFGQQLYFSFRKPAPSCHEV